MNTGSISEGATYGSAQAEPLFLCREAVLSGVLSSRIVHEEAILRDCGAQIGEVEAVLSQAPFADLSRARAAMNLIARRLSPALFRFLVPLLVESANPDLAVTLFERLTENPRFPELLRLFEQTPAMLHYVIAVFSNSQWLGETVIRHPDLLHSLVRDEALDRVRSTEDFRESFARLRSRSFENDLALQLATFKRREYVRIMLRDVLQLATLAETTSEISALSDVMIEEALRVCDQNMRNRFGAPQHFDSDGRMVDTPFVVLALGKLGANELNYSSDVDLLFLYGDGPDAETTSISSREYFVRLAQEVTELLSRHTREGSVFRIDLRLRPQGTQGELAVSLAQALSYYGNAAEDWELQALIKVRFIGGDQQLARSFVRGVQPHVYRGELNFGAIETALESLEKIKQRGSRGLSRGRQTIDVKIDRGGIRDIEFLVQCLQRVYGGNEPWLRSGGTLFSLQKLHDKAHLSGSDFHSLTNAYTFLRTLEHRLQLRLGQQTHKLPAAVQDRCVLYRAVTAETKPVSADVLTVLVREQMAAVTAIYERIIHQQQAAESQVKSSVQRRAFTDSGSAAMLLGRLSSDSPELYAIASDSSLGSAGRRNLLRFLSAATTSTERYRSVIDNAASVVAALPLFERSAFLSEILNRHPEEIDKLFSRTDISDLPERIVGMSREESMTFLRSTFRERLLQTAGRSILQSVSIWQTLDEHTDTADIILEGALSAAKPPLDFAILALGRLGSREFDVLSDADLLFVRSEQCDAQAATHVAESVIEILSAYTRNGTIMSIDTRLRPHGQDGELVSTPAQLASYFATEAHAWEAITYTKARFVAGDARTGEEALSATRALSRFATDERAVSELLSMRERIERSERGPSLKTSPGGSYDLDFMLGVVALRNSTLLPAASLDVRLRAAYQHGWLPEQGLHDLLEAAELFRVVEHAIRVVEGRPRKWIPANEAARRSVEHLTRAILRREKILDLESELLRSTRRVREIYGAVMNY